MALQQRRRAQLSDLDVAPATLTPTITNTPMITNTPTSQYADDHKHATDTPIPPTPLR